MKKIEWENCDKMKIDTSHKTFDRQTNIISTGNIIANTLLGWHVRPFTEVKIGFGQPDRPPGYLRDFDLRGFSRMPSRVRELVKELTQEQSVWVYRLFHYDSNDRRITHGWVVTRSWPGQERGYDILLKVYTGPTYKSEYVVNEASEYLGDETDETKHRYLRWMWR